MALLNRLSAALRGRLTAGSVAPHDQLRLELTRQHGIDVFLDAGANEGLFALRLRQSGFAGRMVSFEPLPEMFEKLESAASADPDWRCLRVALGERSGTATLNVAANWASSSLLPMDARHRLAEPRSSYVRTETCRLARLDELRGEVLSPDETAFLKLDVQGSELAVLRGGERTMEQVALVQVELAIVPLYDGAPLFSEVVQHLDERGYRLFGLEPAFVHPRTGAILQVDGIFAHESH